MKEQSRIGKLLEFPKRKKRSSLSGTLLRAGALEVRIAATKMEIRKAQRLRYKVFFEEGGAIADRTAALIRRDICRFDKAADHLIVIDHAARNRFGRLKPKVVACYRLLRQGEAERLGGFYAAQEFDVAPLLARQADKHFAELGRACVLAPWRSGRALELLWRGIGLYVDHYRIDVLIGCASLPGVDPLRNARALACLAARAARAGAWSARAHGWTPPADAAAAPTAAALEGERELPTLVRGYLRFGAHVGEGAYIDRQFGTTDVFIVMPVADMDPRFFGKFGVRKREKAA